MKTVRWGILGCGNVTEVKSGPGFQKASGSELVAVMRRDGVKAADYARRHNVPRWYDDADALIGDKEVDAVYVATPPGTHEFYAMKVLAAGKPCYVEKPMARNMAEALRMVEGFAAKQVPLFVAYYRRAMPRFLKVKQLIESGILGRAQTAAYQYADGKMLVREEPVPWRLKAEESGGGLFLDLGSHVLDLMDFWFGPVTVRHAKAENRGAYAVEDGVHVDFAAERADLGNVWFDFASKEVADEFTLVFERGTLRLSCFGSGEVRFRHVGGGEEVFVHPNPEHVAQPLIQTVVDDLLSVGECESTGESALRTQEVMDRVLEEYYGGREDGFWGRAWPLEAKM